MSGDAIWLRSLPATEVRRCWLCGVTPRAEAKEDSVWLYCGRCRLLAIDPGEDVGDYYDGFYDRFRDRAVEARRLREQQYRVDASNLLGWGASGRLLDVGCSTGGFLKALEESGGFSTLRGIDPDGSGIARARERVFQEEVLFSEGTLLNAEIEPPYDVVVFRGTFQYTAEHIRVTLRRVREILTDGGRLIILAAPHSESFQFKLYGADWHLFNAFEHRFLINREVIDFIGDDFDFEVDRVAYPYLDTVYADPARDYQLLADSLRDGTVVRTPFWGNMIEAVLRKRPCAETLE